MTFNPFFSSSRYPHSKEMKPIFNTLIGLLLLLSSAVVNGQILDIKFTPAQPTGTVGSVVTVDVIATTFEGIAGMQFPILYDKNKLQFKTCKNLTQDLPGFIFNQASGTPPLCPGGTNPPCATSIDKTADGKLALVWFDPSGAGNYLDNNTVLFQIEFTILQASPADIYIASAPPPAINVFGMGNAPATFTYPTGNAPLIGFALVVPSDSVRPGERVCMPVRVNDFNSIVGMQFMVNWNSSVFTFSHVQSYGLAGMSASNFNSTTAGRLAVQWDDVTGVGVTLPNGTPIFEVCLTANGPNATSGTTSNVACNGVGMPPASPIAIENTQGANVWADPTSSVPGPILISGNAQLENEIVCFRVDTILVPQVGDSAAVTIRIDKFKNLNQFQFVLSYDPNILGTGLPSLSAFGVPNGTLNNGAGGGTQWRIELIAGQPGKLRVSWRTSSAATGQTLADGTVLCTLKFPTNSATPGAFTTVGIGALTAVTPAIAFQAQEKPNSFVAQQRTPNFPYTPCGQAGSVRLGATAALQVTLVSKTDVNCFGANIGAIDISVTGGTTSTYTYNWGSGVTTQDRSNLAPGTYTVTVTAGTATTTFTTAIAGPTAPVSVNPTITNVKCFGETTGALALNATGGTGPYTFLWDGGATTSSRTNLGAGTYAVTVTDSKGCTFVPSPAYTITAPNAAMAVSTSNIKNVRCLNDANGGATINTNNSQGALTYSWRLGGNSFNALPAGAPTNLAAGTYAVTVTDGNQCTASASNIVIAAPAAQLNTDPVTVTAPNCAGQNNGSICFNAFGGWGSYSYQWGSPAPGVGPCPSGVAPGTYNLTITDANGCAIARSATVGQGQDIAINNTTVVDEVCFSQSNGSISIALNGSFASVNWTKDGVPAGSGTTISNLAPGIYVPVVSYGTGCSKTFAGINVNGAQAINVALNSMIQQDNGNDGALDINASGGSAPLTYSWAGPNGFTAATQDITGVNAGMYTVTVKDAKNCTNIQTYEVTQACIVCDASIITTGACTNDGCLTITVPANAPSPFILSWTSSVNPVPQTKVFAPGVFVLQACDLPAASYNVTVTDASGQSSTFPSSLSSIDQRPPVVTSSTEVDPNQGNKNGSITITPGPGAPLTYEWISGNVPVPPNSLTSPVIFQLDSGTYCVRITNLLPGGCSEVKCFDLDRLYPALAPCGTPVEVDPSCLTSNNGSVQVFPQGGDNTFTYNWSNGGTTAKISNLAGGTFTVTVTSGDGQSGVCGPYTIAPLSNLAITNVNELSNYNGFQVAGSALCNGSASVVAGGTTGTISYLWSNGVTTANNTTLCGGTYTVVATDLLGCTSAWSGELTAPTAIAASHNLLAEYNGFSVSCFESCNGSARVVINGGVAPYIVKWPSGQTDIVNVVGGFSVESDLCAGQTNVEVTDANGVKFNYAIELTQPEELSISFTDTAPFSLAECTGEIIPTVTGAVGNLTYNWFSQFHEGNEQRADGLCAEELVTFEITDANGCKIIEEHEVPLPEGICFKATPVVTPNGDGYNDFFEIKCIETVPNTVEIYDRWNQAVISPVSNYQNNFDGKRNGVALPEGVYFFVATFTNDQGIEMTIKGHFNILY